MELLYIILSIPLWFFGVIFIIAPLFYKGVTVDNKPANILTRIIVLAFGITWIALAYLLVV